VREPWKPYYAILKTYSFAWYKDEVPFTPPLLLLLAPRPPPLTIAPRAVLFQLQEDLVGYIPCREILEMKPISELQTKYKHSLQIVSKGEHQIMSLNCEGHPGTSLSSSLLQGTRGTDFIAVATSDHTIAVWRSSVCDCRLDRRYR
jgi:hypothetical protein